MGLELGCTREGLWAAILTGACSFCHGRMLSLVALLVVLLGFWLDSWLDRVDGGGEGDASFNSDSACRSLQADYGWRSVPCSHVFSTAIVA